ncbi:biopolymer transporter ExbD [candidate division KSB1 bacterium]|nr:biopolymer transporter ExbD [candidate division KSB1 bacterium]
MKKYKYVSITEINVTSLVDVTMMLLIIFMITAPFIRSGVEVQLPEASMDALKSQQGVVITLTQQEALFLDGDLIPDAYFDQELLRRYLASHNKTVLLQADRALAYGKIIQLMDRIHAVNITNLGLIVESKLKP